MWQDIVLTAGSVVFAFALLPALKAIEKPALKTCVMTALTLMVVSIVDITLSLWFTAGCTFITAVIWSVLGIQSYKRNHGNQR